MRVRNPSDKILTDPCLDGVFALQWQWPVQSYIDLAFSVRDGSSGE